MKFTLEFIARYLGIPEAQCVSSSAKRRYSRVLLGSDQRACEDSEALCVVEHLPASGSVSAACGYIVVNGQPPSEGAPASACPALFVGESHSVAEVLNEVSLMFERFNRWELELRGFVGEPDGLQRACDYLFEAFGNPVYFVDESFKVLAIKGSRDAYETGYVWKHLVDDGYMPWNVIDELVSKNEISVMEGSTPAVLVNVSSLNTPFVNLVLRDKGALKGFFFVVGLTKRLGEDDVELVDELAPAITSVFRSGVDMALLSGQRHEVFLRDLARGNLIGSEVVRLHAALAGMDPDAEYLVCVFDAQSRHDLVRTETLHALEGVAHCNSLVIDENVMAVCELPRKGSLEQAMKRMRTLAKRVRCRAAVSESFSGLADLPTYYNQAKLALEHGQAEEGSLVAFSDSYFRVLAGVLGEAPFGKDVFVNRDAIVLSRYDSAHGTDYAETLLGYVFHDRNSVQAAAALHIHRSTLTYRLAKIEEICEMDLADRERTLAAAFSLFLLRFESA